MRTLQLCCLISLKKINPKHIYIAGFDGFDFDVENNYVDESYQNDRHIKEFDDINKDVSAMLYDIIETIGSECPIKFITPSKYIK